MEGNSGSFVAYNNYVAMFRGSIRLNKRRRDVHPNSTEYKLNEGTYGNDEVRGPRYHHPPHHSPWNCDLEGQNHSKSFGQDCGESHREQHCKCALLQDTGGGAGMADEEQWTEKTEGQSDEQDVSESLIVGLDNGRVVVLPKDN